MGERPISSYQGMQFPLAEAKAMLEAARLNVYEADWLHNRASPKMRDGHDHGEIRCLPRLDLRRGPCHSDHGRQRIHMRIWGGKAGAGPSPKCDCTPNERDGSEHHLPSNREYHVLTELYLKIIRTIVSKQCNAPISDLVPERPRLGQDPADLVDVHPPPAFYSHTVRFRLLCFHPRQIHYLWGLLP
jgi:hypothetical protein